jgi:benzoyl-CoA 2,3-dioxygenase component B
MKELNTDDPAKLRAAGVIDLPTLQRYLNFHFSVTLDLYGSEVSTNAAAFYSAGLKGRFQEEQLTDDHLLAASSYDVPAVDGGRIVTRHEKAQLALNERLRDDYIEDCQAGVDRWNKLIEKAGTGQKLQLPHKGFHRRIGNFAGAFISPAGEVLAEAEWRANEKRWLPLDEDHAFVQSLMAKPVTKPGQFAGYIAPPRVGINNQPLDFEYVRFD